MMGIKAYAQELTQMLNNYSNWMKETSSYNIDIQVYMFKSDAKTPYYHVELLKQDDASLTIARNINYLVTSDYSLVCDHDKKRIAIQNSEEVAESYLGYEIPEFDSGVFDIEKRIEGDFIVFDLRSQKLENGYTYMRYIFYKNGRLKSVKYGLDSSQGGGYSDVEIEYNYRKNLAHKDILEVESYLKVGKKKIELQDQYLGYELFNNMGYVNR